MGHVVDGQMWVFAYPDPTAKRDRKGPIQDPGRASWPYRQFTQGEIDDFSKEVHAAKFPGDPNLYLDPDGPWYVIAYDGLNDLIFAISILLRDETWATGTGASAVIHHGPCLRVLEIHSHANPDRCGGITAATVNDFAKALDALNYCDALDIYLSGCNTGCRDWNDAHTGPSDQECVAELLADQLPGALHPPKTKRVTVYGTKGYSWGTHAGGNSRCERVAREGDTYEPAYPNSENAKQTPTSDPTFRGFRGPNSA